MRNVIPSLVLWATWLLAPAGIVVLLVKRRFRTAFGFVGAIATIIAFYYTVLRIPDRHLRMWLAVPSVILIGFLVILGIWICGAAWAALNGMPREPIEEDILGTLRGPWLTRRRTIAATIMMSAVAAWFFGVANPQLSDWQFLPMIYSFYGFALGTYLFVHPAAPSKQT